MNLSVLFALEDASEGVDLKHLKKLALEHASQQDGNEGKKKKALKEEFESALNELLEENKISEVEGLYTKSIKKSSKKRQRKEDVVEKDDDIAEAKAGGSNHEALAPTTASKPLAVIDEDEQLVIKKKGKTDLTALSCKIDLSRNGEQAWREGSLSQEYLSTNPDGITRLFCGNLNKKITEEELKSAIEGITFIKWITDKQTREFYGSTFLEIKDPRAAATAVMKDKSKFMGR
jgi:hypothetical protein